MTAQLCKSVCNQRRAQVRRATIYSEVLGQGEPLLLLHGLGGSTRWWSRNIAALSHWHEVHILDMHGFGRSGGRFVLAEAADVLAEWMQCSGIKKASMIGHSMGGYVVADLAAQRPELINKLVLVDPAISVAGFRPNFNQRSQSGTFLPVPLSFLSVAIADAARAGLPTLARAACEMMKRDMGPTLERIKASTLLIWGEHDPAVPVSMGRELARRLDQAKLRIIAGAGHTPMWEKPHLFNRTVAEFLASVA